jgi:cysteine desulfuration protein SufE
LFIIVKANGFRKKILIQEVLILVAPFPFFGVELKHSKGYFTFMSEDSRSFQIRLDHLADEFEFLDDWETKYRHIIDMGRNLPPIDPIDKSDSNKIRGCASQVWLVCSYSDKTGKIEFSGESDSTLVQGLLAILINLYSSATPTQITSLTAEKIFARLGLAEALTPNRTNGLKSIAAKIIEFAQLHS